MADQFSAKEAANYRRYIDGGLSMHEALSLILMDRATEWEEQSDAS